MSFRLDCCRSTLFIFVQLSCLSYSYLCCTFIMCILAKSTARTCIQSRPQGSASGKKLSLEADWSSLITLATTLVPRPLGWTSRKYLSLSFVASLIFLKSKFCSKPNLRQLVVPKIRTQRYFNSFVPWGVRNCVWCFFSSQRVSLLCVTTVLQQCACVEC